MQILVEFTSEMFPPIEGEEQRVISDRVKLLAQYIRSGLLKRGIDAKQPIADDWIWRVPIEFDHDHLIISCGSRYGCPNEYFCIIRLKKSGKRVWFQKNRTTSQSIGAVRSTLDDLLDASAIQNKKWQDLPDDFPLKTMIAFFTVSTTIGLVVAMGIQDSGSSPIVALAVGAFLGVLCTHMIYYHIHHLMKWFRQLRQRRSHQQTLL